MLINNNKVAGPEDGIDPTSAREQLARCSLYVRGFLKAEERIKLLEAAPVVIRYLIREGIINADMQLTRTQFPVWDRPTDMRTMEGLNEELYDIILKIISNPILNRTNPEEIELSFAGTVEEISDRLAARSGYIKMEDLDAIFKEPDKVRSYLLKNEVINEAGEINPKMEFVRSHDESMPKELPLDPEFMPTVSRTIKHKDKPDEIIITQDEKAYGALFGLIRFLRRQRPEDVYVASYDVEGRNCPPISPREVMAIYVTRGAGDTEGGQSLNMYRDFFIPALYTQTSIRSKTNDELVRLSEELANEIPVEDKMISVSGVVTIQPGLDHRRLIHYLAAKPEAFEYWLALEPMHAVRDDKQSITYMVGGNHKYTALFMRDPKSWKTRQIKFKHYDCKQNLTPGERLKIFAGANKTREAVQAQFERKGLRGRDDAACFNDEYINKLAKDESWGIKF